VTIFVKKHPLRNGSKITSNNTLKNFILLYFLPKHHPRRKPRTLNTI
jgi:hypothetical protein